MEATALIPLLKPLIERAQPEWKKNQQALRLRFADEVTRAIAEHHVYVSRWCQEAHAVAYGNFAIDAPTVDLTFRTIPRRVGIGGKDIDEIDVLLSAQHTAVLGDPGAGKTTTLRRLANYVAHEPQLAVDDHFRFVVLIVCREERWDTSKLYDVLGERLGVTGKMARDLDNPESRMREVLEVGALIIIDGLDEVPPRLRPDLDRQITQLARHLGTAKIVVSCRSADYLAPLLGFEVAEIRPLNGVQIRRVVNDLLGDTRASAFFRALDEPRHPARDLMNRPLFLTQMVAIFSRRGTIPERPIDLYESITRLILQEWDEQRGIQRVSKYGKFGVDDKRRFLADLAYELIRDDLLRFEEADLIRIYPGLAERYGLPKSESKRVVRELESHTGLLVESGELYEFSHLSLQEFLAADSMVRATSSSRGTWWTTYPSVAAIAVAMSSDANSWFAELVAQMPPSLGDRTPVQSFLYRLGQEGPRFFRSADLGVSLLYLLFRGDIQDPTAVARLRGMKAIRGSLTDALRNAHRIHVTADLTYLTPVRSTERASLSPISISVSTAVLNVLVGEDTVRQVIQLHEKASKSLE